MENVGLILFLLLWGLVVIRQLLILLRHFGREVPHLSDDSVFRGTWLIRPRDGDRGRALSADIAILAAYLLVEVVILVFLIT
jgi:hypothetical protein